MRLAEKKSLLLVTVDCLRADHVGFMGYDRPTTPFLDTLACDSFVISSAIVGGAPTYYSVPSILASRFPLDLGRDQLGLAPGEATLATLLREAGYATAAFCAGNPYISSRFGYDQGFDTFEDYLNSGAGSVVETKPLHRNDRWARRVNRGIAAVSQRFGPVGKLYDELYFQYCQRWATPAEKSLDVLRRFPAADVIVDAALSWLQSRGDQPFFLWLHLMDPHSPYYPPEPALEAMNSRGWTPFRARYQNSFWNRGDVGTARLARHRGEIVELYDAGIRWVDMQVGRLVEELKKAEHWDQCVMAVSADHGEEFLDHGGRYHPPAHLKEELIHVPLLLRVPGSSTKKQSAAPFSLLHLAPTLLEALGQPSCANFHGRSLWAQIKAGSGWENPAISECVAGCTNPFLPQNRLGARVLAVRDARYKLILYFDPPGELLFDLETDPGEQAPLSAGTEKLVRRRLLEVARDHMTHSATRRDLQARVRSRLRDLQLEWGAPPAQPVAS